MSDATTETSARAPGWLGIDAVRDLLTNLFTAAGVPAAAARTVGEALVEADLEGLPSHGVAQAEVYLERLLLGSVTTHDAAAVVVDSGAMAVLDGRHMLGHLVANQAMALAVAKAKQLGVGAVSVRHAFHFGAAGRYVRQAAEAGCIGIAMCNSRAVMPAPGGAQRLVGTNPLAVGVPTATEPPFILDMATSAGTVGRIRAALRAGSEIPETWAVDAEGRPTRDPKAALEGMLLPIGGAKGFGLSLMVDLMAGLLSSGAWGDAITGLHIKIDEPFDTAHFFLALDIEHFRPLSDFLAEADTAAERVRSSSRAPGIDRVLTPGQRRWEAAHSGQTRIKLQPSQLHGLTRLCGRLGVDATALENAEPE